jgi:hypothetical protein
VQGNSSTAVTFSFDYVKVEVTYIESIAWTQQGGQLTMAPRRSVAGMSQKTFVPQLSAAPSAVFVHGQSPDPGVLLSFQYPSHAQPPLVSAAPFTYLPYPQSDQVNRPSRRLAQSFAGPVQVSTTTQQQVYVLGQSVDPSSVIGFQYPTVSQPIQTGAAESITLDKWNSVPPLPDKHRHRVRGFDFAIGRDVAPRMEWALQGPIPIQRRVSLRGDVSRSFVTDVVTVPAIYIAGQSVDPSSLIGFQYPSFAQPVQIGSGAPAETLTLDKWLSQSREPVRQARRLAIYGVNCAIAKEVIETMEWSIQSALPRRPRQGLKDYSFSVFTTGAGPDPTTPAVFIQGQSVDPQSVRGFQFDSLSFPLRSLTEIVTVDKWLTDLSVRFARKLFREGRSPLPQLVSEQLTLDKWQQQTVLPQRRSPSVRVDRSDLLLTEYLTLDKWNIQIPEIRRAVRTREGLFVLPSQGENLTIDKWNVQTVGATGRKRVFIDPQSAYVKVAPLGDLITLDKWLSYQPTQFPKPKVIEGAFRFYVIPILTIPPTSLPALWRNEATISLIAADLQAIGIQAEDVQSISVMAVSLAETDLITSNSALVSVTTKDEQSITILYEDVRSV